jgi:hypothetical protein
VPEVYDLDDPGNESGKPKASTGRSTATRKSKARKQPTIFENPRVLGAVLGAVILASLAFIGWYLFGNRQEAASAPSRGSATASAPVTKTVSPQRSSTAPALPTSQSNAPGFAPTAADLQRGEAPAQENGIHLPAD